MKPTTALIAAAVALGAWALWRREQEKRAQADAIAKLAAQAGGYFQQAAPGAVGAEGWLTGALGL